MKKSKLCLIIWTISTFISFWLAANNENPEKELFWDISHAIQHIKKNISIINEGNQENKATIKDDYNKLNINSNNFLLDKNMKKDKKTPSIKHSKWSSILWWKDNIIWEQKESNYDVILWWQENEINGWYNTIWWYKNKIDWNYSVIVWWQENTISNNYNTIIWWKSNNINWQYSTILWINNSIKWNNSYILWKNIQLNWNNSFVWSDWRNNKQVISQDNIFTVLSENWVVINDDTANKISQLTNNGSLIIYPKESDNEIICWWWQWKGTLKVVQQSESNKYCFCNCNWQEWSSLIWEWKCQATCLWAKDSLMPECWETVEEKEENWQKYRQGSCKKWNIIEWSYFTKQNTVYWTCQESDWSIAQCAVVYEGCQGNIPTNAHRNNETRPSEGNTQYNYSLNLWTICSFSCDKDYTRNSSTGKCEPIFNWTECTKGHSGNIWEWFIKCNNDIDSQTYACPEYHYFDWTKCAFYKELKANEDCGSDKYTCKNGATVVNQWSNILEYTWQCKNYRNTVSCSKPRTKETVNITQYRYKYNDWQKIMIYFTTDYNKPFPTNNIVIKHSRWEDEFELNNKKTKEELFTNNISFTQTYIEQKYILNPNTETVYEYIINPTPIEKTCEIYENGICYEATSCDNKNQFQKMRIFNNWYATSYRYFESANHAEPSQKILGWFNGIEIINEWNDPILYKFKDKSDNIQWFEVKKTTIDAQSNKPYIVSSDYTYQNVQLIKDGTKVHKCS